MIPGRLRRGDTVGIVAPSNAMVPEYRYLLDGAVRKLESLGLKAALGKHCLDVDRYGVSAGEPEGRAEDLNAMFSDRGVKAIYCAHGGETANQLLPLVDFGNITRHPKILLGMSDIDVLHLAINRKTGLVVFHGSDPKSGRGLDLDIPYTWESFRRRMLQADRAIPASSPRKCVRKGKAEGRLLGCNISSILKLAGTPYFPDFSGAVLFLESYLEDTRKAICELQQLKEIGVFDRIQGLVIGHVLGFQKERWIKEHDIKARYEELILDMTREYDFPILKTDDFGHESANCYLPIGGKVEIDAERKTVRMAEDFLV